MNTLVAVIIGLVTVYLASPLYARRIHLHLLQAAPKRPKSGPAWRLPFTTKAGYRPRRWMSDLKKPSMDATSTSRRVTRPPKRWGRV